MRWWTCIFLTRDSMSISHDAAAEAQGMRRVAGAALEVRLKSAEAGGIRARMVILDGGYGGVCAALASSSSRFGELLANVAQQRRESGTAAHR